MERVPRTRTIGLEPSVEPAFFESDVRDGDIWSACSDGVSIACPRHKFNPSFNVVPAHAHLSALREKPPRHPEIPTTMPRQSSSKSSNTTGTRPVFAALWRLSNPCGQANNLTATPSFAPCRKAIVSGSPNPTEPSVFLLKFPPLKAAWIEPVATLLCVKCGTPANSIARFRPRFCAQRRPPALLRNGICRGANASGCSAKGPCCPLKSRSVRFPVACYGKDQVLVSFDLVHGDIKPDNVLVLRNADSCSFLVLDLGSAVEVFSINSRAGTELSRPERFHGSAISERTEVYAIGATLYEALTGLCPYGEIERFQTPASSSSTTPLEPQCQYSALARLPHSAFFKHGY